MKKRQGKRHTAEQIIRKLRGMAIMFQEEMRLDARPAGEAPPQPRTDGQNQIHRHQVKKP